MKKTFSEQFGIAPKTVIDAMDKNGDDIPLQSPKSGIEIQKVGVVRDNVPITVISPFDPQEITTLNAKLILDTLVPNTRRGIHMSRIGHIVAKLSEDQHDSIVRASMNLANQLSATQYDTRSSTRIVAPFSFITTVPGRNGVDKKSLDSISLMAGFDTDTGHGHVGVGVDHMTACPCVQQTLKHTLVESGEMDTSKVDVLPPLMTHSQRSKTFVSIEGKPEALPSITEIHGVLDEALTLVQNTLPREHELALVHRAHANPQFIEDVVRDVATRLKKMLGSIKTAMVTVKSSSIESIHGFDIHAECSLV